MTRKEYPKVDGEPEYMCDTCKMKIAFFDEVDICCPFCNKIMRPVTEQDRTDMHEARLVADQARRN